MRNLDADQILMQRVRDGDDTAFEVLVQTYQGLVLSLCRRYLGSRYAGVEDVAQDVFLRVYRSRSTYEPRAKVKTWIYGITVNACLNEIRRLRSKKNRAVATFTAVFGDDRDEAPPLPAPDVGGLPGGALDDERTSARVREAVDRLPEQQRLALVLSRFHHCSYEDVAATMDTTIPAVKSLLTRARDNLRRSLRDLVEGAAPASASAGAVEPMDP